MSIEDIRITTILDVYEMPSIDVYEAVSAASTSMTAECKPWSYYPNDFYILVSLCKQTFSRNFKILDWKET